MLYLLLVFIADFTNCPTGRGVSYSIAAYNSNSLIKEQADFVCDGIDDQIEIQEAINNCFADSGGTVFFHNGIYKISNSLHSGDNVALEGTGGFSDVNDSIGGGCEIRNLSNAAAIILDSIYLDMTEVHSVRIENLKITGTDSSGHGIYSEEMCGGLILRNLRLLYHGGKGIYLEGGTHWASIENVYISRQTGTALQIKGGQYANIENCHIANPSDKSQDALILQGCNHIKISMCTIEAASNAHGIQVGYTYSGISKNIIIVGNRFKNNNIPIGLYRVHDVYIYDNSFEFNYGNYCIEIIPSGTKIKNVYIGKNRIVGEDSLISTLDYLNHSDELYIEESANWLRNKTKTILIPSLGYHLGGDSIVLETGDTIAVPSIGMTFIDTSGGDTTKTYLNSRWEVK